MIDVRIVNEELNDVTTFFKRDPKRHELPLGPCGTEMIYDKKQLQAAIRSCLFGGGRRLVSAQA